MEAAELIGKLNDITARKLELLQEMESCTVKQHGCIKSGMYDEVDKIIEEKQKLMNEIDGLDAEFAECMETLKKLLNISSFEDLPAFSIAGTRELRELVGKVYEVLCRIRDVDKENTDMLRNELAKASDQIAHANAFKKASMAYGPKKPVNPSYFFDKKN